MASHSAGEIPGMSLSPDLAALEPALEHSWRIFPCAPRDKNPLLTDWPRRASSNADVISRWAEKYRACNWGVACGPESSVFVLDVDGERGENSLRSLVEQHGTWEKTLTASTARGTHFYFQYPAAETIIRNSASKIGAGIDVRGRRGYTIIPPSTHPSGTTYQWAGEPQVAPAPDWLLESITSAARPIIEASEIGILPEGCRNDGLARLAGALRRKGKSRTEIESELLAANLRRCRPPLRDDEVRKIAGSIMRYAPGGLDPLEAAWQATQSGGSNYERFLALAVHLQKQRPGQAIALPLERIAGFFKAHWTTVSRYRMKAVAEGLLDPAGEYIAHRRAGSYRCSEMLTKMLTSGLVSIVTPSEQAKSPLVSITPSEQALPLVSTTQVTKASERENFPPASVQNWMKLRSQAWEPPTFVDLGDGWKKFQEQYARA